MTTHNKTARDYRRLNKLENLEEWQVHHDDTDIRDWKVYANDGTKVGEVENLIADKAAKKVRYVEIELEEDLAGLDHLKSNIETRYEDGDRYIIVPIGLINIDRDDDVVRVNSLNTNLLYNTPRYNRAAGVKPEHEVVLYKYLIGPAGNPAADKTRTIDEADYVGAPGMEAEFYESSYFSSTPYTDSIKDRRNRDLKATTHQSLS